MLPGEVNHARGYVTGNELNPLPGEMNSVDARAAVKFEQLLAWREDLRESSPNGIASRFANTRTAKVLDVGLGRSVPVCLRKVSGVGTHREQAAGGRSWLYQYPIALGRTL